MFGSNVICSFALISLIAVPASAQNGGGTSYNPSMYPNQTGTHNSTQGSNYNMGGTRGWDYTSDAGGRSRVRSVHQWGETKSHATESIIERNAVNRSSRSVGSSSTNGTFHGSKVGAAK